MQSENKIREALLLGRSFVELAGDDLGRDVRKSLAIMDAALAALASEGQESGAETGAVQLQLAADYLDHKGFHVWAQTVRSAAPPQESGKVEG